MAVLSNRYKITNTQSQAGFVPVSQIKSTTVQTRNTDNYRPISYSSEMKQAAKSAGLAGQYYLWQDNPDATGSAAWMEKQLKNKGIDLSSKSNTGNAVADFFIEAGKGVIEIPIGLKRTLSAGTLGAVGVSKQSAGQAVKTLSEGADKAIKSTVDSAIDNPGRFIGAVVGGIVLTKGIGKLTAVPKPKVTTSKTSTKTNPTVTTIGTGKPVSTTARTISVSAGKRTASITIQKAKTTGGTQKITTAGVINTKTGATKAAQVVRSKSSTIQRGNGAINSMLKGRKIVVKDIGIRAKSINKKGVIKETGVGKRSGNIVSTGGTLKVHGKDTIRRTKIIAEKSIGTKRNKLSKQTIRRTETNIRKLTKDGKTETRMSGNKQKSTEYTLNDKPYNPNAISKKDKKILNKSAKARTKEMARKERLNKKAERKHLRTMPALKVTKNKRTPAKKSQPAKQSKPDNIRVVGTVYTKPKTNTGGTGSSTSNHGSSGGLMYQTRSKTTNRQTASGTYQTANILKGQQTAKTAGPKQKVRGAVAGATKKATASKTSTKTKPAITTIDVQAYKKTTSETRSNELARRNSSGNKEKSKAGAALAVTQAHRRTTAQAKKQAQRQKQSEIQKRAQAVKRKQKKLVRLRDEEKKKKLQKAKDKKSNGYLRSETRNTLSWIQDNSKLMIEKKLKN